MYTRPHGVSETIALAWNGRILGPPRGEVKLGPESCDQRRLSQPDRDAASDDRRGHREATTRERSHPGAPIHHELGREADQEHEERESEPASAEEDGAGEHRPEQERRE